MFNRNWRPLVLIAGESCVLTGAVIAGMFVRLGNDSWWLIKRKMVSRRDLLIVAVCQLTLYYSDLYDLRAISGIRDLTMRLIEAIGATSLILAGIYFLAPDLIIGRGVFLIAAGFIVSFVVGWRMAFAWLTRSWAPRERLLLVGTSGAAVDLARELFERRQELGVEIVGFVDPDPARVGMPLINPGVDRHHRRHSITRRFAECGPRRRQSRRRAGKAADGNRLLDIRLDNGVAFDHLASLYEEYTGKIAVENLRPSWLIFLGRVSQDSPAAGGEADARRRFLDTRPRVGLPDYGRRRHRGEVNFARP